jgi:hypothetical protein
MLISQETIAIIVVALTGIVPYILTRNKEINAKIREKKTDMYDELINALTSLTGNKLGSDLEAINTFRMAFYKSSVYASDSVIDACHQFFVSLGEKESDLDVLTKHVSEIYNAIRKDIDSTYSSKVQVFTVEPIDKDSLETCPTCQKGKLWPGKVNVTNETSGNNGETVRMREMICDKCGDKQVRKVENTER